MGNLNAPTISTVTIANGAVSKSSATYAAGTLILALITADTANNAATCAFTNSGTAQTWHTITQNTTSATNGACYLGWAVVGAGGFTGTITATMSNQGGSLPVTIEVITFTSAGNAFSTTAPLGTGAQGTFSAVTAFTRNITTTAANSWCGGIVYNFTRTATCTANGSSVITHQGDDGNGDQYVRFLRGSTTVQPTDASGAVLTLGGSFAASATGCGLLFEVLDPGGGGTNYTPSQTDAVGITDAATAVQDNVRSQSDALGITDAVTPAQDNARTQSDAIGLTDSVTAAQSQFVAPSDPIGITDAASAAQALTRTQSDAIGITDSVTAVSGPTRQVDDPLGITDLATAVQTLIRTQSDAVGLVDTLTPIQDLVRTVTDAIGLTDSVTAVLSGVTDHIFTTQTPQSSGSDIQVNLGVFFGTLTAGNITGLRYYKTGRLTGDTIIFLLYNNDTNTQLATASYTETGLEPNGWISVPITPVAIVPGVNYVASYNSGTASGYDYTANELATSVSNPPLFTGATSGGRYDYGTSANPTQTTNINWYVDVDFVPTGGTDYTASPTDAVGITDSAAAAQDLARTQVDPIGITDAAIANQDLVRVQSDPIGITDSATAQVGAVVSISDPIGITDAAAAAQDNARTQTDAVGITDAANAAQALARVVSDPVGITDSVSAVLSGVNYTATINDAIGITDTDVQQAVGYDYTLDPEPIGITDDVTAGLGVSRTQSDPIGITDTATAAQALARTLSDPVGITDSVTAVLVPAGAAVVNDPENITDLVSATQANSRQLDDPVGLTDAVSASVGFTRALADAIGLTDSVSATVAMLRALADSIGITDTVTAVITPGAPINYVAVINDSVGITDEVTAELPRRDIVVAVTTGVSPWAVTTGTSNWAATTGPARFALTTLEP